MNTQQIVSSSPEIVEHTETKKEIKSKFKPLLERARDNYKAQQREQKGLDEHQLRYVLLII